MALGGQWCTSPGYAYVHESVAQTFVEEARKALVSLYGVHSKDNPDYSRIISGHAVRRLAGMIDPAKVVADGESDADARYLDPTILYPVQWEAAGSSPFLPTARWMRRSAGSRPLHVPWGRLSSAATRRQSIASLLNCLSELVR
jgi:acyl-CoA reductase-like NAD-dependent aldehyde dehydrogenase